MKLEAGFFINIKLGEFQKSVYLVLRPDNSENEYSNEEIERHRVFVRFDGGV